jgi:hypothetical protein
VAVRPGKNKRPEIRYYPNPQLPCFALVVSVTNGTGVVTVIEGILIQLSGAGIRYALPIPVTGLRGAVFLIVGAVVLVKGLFKSSEIHKPVILLFV